MESNWTMSHVGLVVKDWQKTVEYYKSLDIFNIPDAKPHIMEGKKVKVMGTHIYLGNLWIEVWQPMSGNTTQQQFLDTHGEGINHVCFDVPDLARERESMNEKGVPVLFNIRDSATYYNTSQKGNMLIELRQKGHPMTPQNHP